MRHRHLVGIVTKSSFATRDLDILVPTAAQDLVKVALSMTCLDSELARCMEPRALHPQKRLAAISALS